MLGNRTAGRSAPPALCGGRPGRLRRPGLLTALLGVVLPAVLLAATAAAVESRVAVRKEVYEPEEPVIVEYFASTMTDTFELTGSGWRSSTMSRRLEEASVMAWGAIAQGFVSGLGAAGCVAAFGGVIDLDCY